MFTPADSFSVRDPKHLPGLLGSLLCVISFWCLFFKFFRQRIIHTFLSHLYHLNPMFSLEMRDIIFFTVELDTVSHNSHKNPSLTIWQFFFLIYREYTCTITYVCGWTPNITAHSSIILSLVHPCLCCMYNIMSNNLWLSVL